MGKSNLFISLQRKAVESSNLVKLVFGYVKFFGKEIQQKNSDLNALSKMLTLKMQVYCFAEVESSRTSLALRTHFEVLGHGLEASSPRKLPCPRLEDSTIFLTVEISLENVRNLAENLRRPFFVFLTWSIGVFKRGGPRGPLPPPIEISPKASFAFSGSVSF